MRNLEKKMNEVQKQMIGYFMQFILQRRKQPQNDLISHLISADLDGEPLSDKQLIGFCGLLIVAP